MWLLSSIDYLQARSDILCFEILRQLSLIRNTKMQRMIRRFSHSGENEKFLIWGYKIPRAARQRNWSWHECFISFPIVLSEAFPVCTDKNCSATSEISLDLLGASVEIEIPKIIFKKYYNFWYILENFKMSLKMRISVPEKCWYFRKIQLFFRTSNPC